MGIVFNVCVRLGRPAFPTVRRALPFDKAPSLSLTPLRPPTRQDKHFQLVSQTLQMRFNGSYILCLSLVFLSLPLSLFLLLTVTTLVS